MAVAHHMERIICTSLQSYCKTLQLLHKASAPSSTYFCSQFSAPSSTYFCSQFWYVNLSRTQGEKFC